MSEEMKQDYLDLRTAIALLRESVGWILDLELKKRIDALLALYPEMPK